MEEDYWTEESDYSPDDASFGVLFAFVGLVCVLAFVGVKRALFP